MKATVFKSMLMALTWMLLGGGCATPPAPQTQATESFVSIKPQQGWADAILYFVLIDRYVDLDLTNDYQVDRAGKGTFHGGDLPGLQAHLDELADLGVTAIWINPVVKNIDHYVDEVGFPDWAYHGYWADDFTRLDRRFGTEQELREFVTAAHRRGIKVLLDVVYNHAGYGSSYATRPDADRWVRTGRKGNPCGEDDVTMCVAGLPDFKTEDPYVADYLMHAHLGRAKRMALDGFRLDTVKHVSHAFWQQHRRRCRQELGGDFFLLGEVWGGDEEVLDPWFENDELDAGFDFSFQGNVLSFVQGRGRTIAFSRYLERRHRVRTGHLLAQFLSSHDVPGALYQLKGNKDLFKLCAVLQFASLGIPVIYYGEEVGRLGGAWPDNRSDMPWNGRDILPGKGLPRDEDMRSFYKHLISIRRGHSALRHGAYRALATEGDLLVYARDDGKETVVVAVNRGSSAATMSVPLQSAWKGGGVRDALCDSMVSVEEGNLQVNVPARQARIYVWDQGGGDQP
ncbi:MAG: alpha-amylase family glycosyl hydrolase [Syntrophaceae bacterium]